MIKKLLCLLVLLLTATTTWAEENRLYLDVSGTSATLKYGSDFSGKPYYNLGSWSTDIGVVRTTVQTITTDASCANYSGTLKFLFSEFTALTSVDLSGLNTANVTAINSMFNCCSSLTSVDLSGLNTANVTVMNNLFGYCTSLTSVNLSGLNTSKVTNMGSLFSDCSSLTSVDLSSWDTSSATKMGNMFYGCSALTSVNLSSFNTSNVDGMARMFNSCSSLTTLDLSSFNTSKVTTMTSMFDGCTNLATIYVGNDWSTAAVKSSDNMFINCTNLPNFNSSKLDHTKAHTGEGGYLKVKAKTYKVTLQEGTEDATNWTVPEEAEEGATVTVTYSGSRKVKSVKATTDAVPVVYPMAAEATAADYGKVVCAAGHLHDAKTAVPKGCTAVAVFAYIDGSNNRYGIALQNAASKATWNTITSNGANKNKLCNVPGTWTVTAPTGAEWKVATKAIYEAMFINLGSTKSDSDGTTYDANVNAFITTGVGGTAISGDFWSTTEKPSTDAWCFRTQYWDFYGKSDIDCNVRPVLVW